MSDGAAFYHCCVGLLVDSAITHPFEFNFYLNAHVRVFLFLLLHEILYIQRKQ